MMEVWVTEARMSQTGASSTWTTEILDVASIEDPRVSSTVLRRIVQRKASLVCCTIPLWWSCRQTGPIRAPLTVATDNDGGIQQLQITSIHNYNYMEHLEQQAKEK